MTNRGVRIRAGPNAIVHGDLVVPDDAGGLVVFAHGSGSSRHSPRNQRVADVLQRCNIATLLCDLLTEAEEAVDRETGRHRFDIPLLAQRLDHAVSFAVADQMTASLPVGLFGASTGAAAALVAAARRPDRIAAVVSRGGRPDLAGAALLEVQAPTLLIVGDRDQEVVELNERAMGELRCQYELVVVPGATHLFEEAGALDTVARLAGDWFATHLVGAAQRQQKARR